MEKFLDFLASNYIYFLIAAGVLFFALIGFIVDLKKKGKSEEEEVREEVPMTEIPVETPVLEPSIETQPVVPEVVEPAFTLEEEAPVAVQEFNPAPAMPEVEVVQPDKIELTPPGQDNISEIEELK